MARVLCLTLALLVGFWAQPSTAQFHSKFCADYLSLPLPVVPQSTDFTCGVACFDSVLRYWRGGSPGEIPLAYGLGTTLNAGTGSGAIVAAARMYGFFAQEQFGTTVFDLQRYLARGETIYVGWRLDGVGHYSLVRGIGHDHITLMDPWYAREHPGQYNTMSFAEFLPLWNNGVNWFGQIIRISPYPLYP